MTWETDIWKSPLVKAAPATLDRHDSEPNERGLERSCAAERGDDWMRQSAVVGGVRLFEAHLRHVAYRRHRHDEYAICLTDAGVQSFTYRGALHQSLPGEVVVLHPDEAHDGRPGTESGFAYRQLYVEPAVIFEAMRALSGRPRALPFVRQPVGSNSMLAAAVRAAFTAGDEPLAADELALNVAAGLVAADPGAGRVLSPRLDLAAIERARQFLDAECGRVIRSAELEAAAGLDRFDLARQFRLAYGTSPYRYSLLRRLGRAREEIARRRPLVDVALDAQFADQAHFTRQFSAAFGLTPGRFRDLTKAEPASSIRQT